ncbi:hypothetical protein ABMA28_004220 [Loxostege sticticalis]|uniref:Uncharacterized protein n=1 Tax=Loxostege sticticalis TaxID=481309 RepID=A0ABD0SUP0_LOXSC
MYTIELIIFVALNVHITIVLHLAHKKTSSSGSGPVASPLVMDPRIMLDTEMIDATQSDKLSSHKTDVTHANSFLVRQRRGFASDIFNKAKGAIGSTIQKGTDFAGDVVHTVGDKVNSGVNKVGETIQKGKDFAGDVVHTVGDTVSSGVNKVGETIEGGKNLAINTVGTVEKMGELAWAGLKLAKGGIDLVLSVFIPLSQEEEKAVKWIRPILGMYTPAAFRLTKSPVVMTAWASAIGVEVFFILLNIYLTTTKKRYYDTMENVC